MSKLFSGAPLTPPSAPALMRLYHPGSSAFISPRVSLLTHGIHAAVEVHDPQCISSHAQALLDEVAHEAIVPPLVLVSNLMRVSLSQRACTTAEVRSARSTSPFAALTK